MAQPERWLPGWGVWGLLALVAIAIGLVLAKLPLLWAALGLLIAILLVLTLIDPLVGLGVALVLGPTKPVTDLYVPQLPLDIGQIALVISLCAWLLHIVRRHHTQIPRSPLLVPLLLFTGAAGLSLLNALSLGLALKEFIKWVQIILVMWLVIDLGGARRLSVIVGLVLGAAVAQALIGVWQFGLRGDGPEFFQILGGRFYRAYGTFEQPNPYGGFLGLSASLSLGLTLGALAMWFKPVWAVWQVRRPVALRNLARTIFNVHLPRLAGCALMSGVLLAALLMSWSRGAWLGFGAAALAMLFAWPRKTWIGAVLVIGSIIALGVALQLGLLPASLVVRATDLTGFTQTFDVRGTDINDVNYAVLERLAHWQAAQDMTRYHPLFGVGFGNYEAAYPAYALVNWPHALGHAHNFYLNLLAETGIIGLAAYLTLWFSVLWQTWRVTRRTDIWQRYLAVGLLGAWTHLSVHHLVDKLYVANLHLHIGTLLGVLSVIILMEQEKQSLDRYD